MMDYVKSDYQWTNVNRQIYAAIVGMLLPLAFLKYFCLTFSKSKQKCLKIQIQI